MDFIETLIAVVTGTVIGRWLYDYGKTELERSRSIKLRDKYWWVCHIPGCSFRVEGSEEDAVRAIVENHERSGLHGYENIKGYPQA